MTRNHLIGTAQRGFHQLATNVNNPHKIHGAMFVLVLFAMAAALFSQTALFIGLLNQNSTNYSHPSRIQSVFEGLGILSIQVDPGKGEYSVLSKDRQYVVYSGVGSHDIERLPSGSYIVQFYPLMGFITPSVTPVHIFTNSLSKAIGNYKPAL